MEHPFFDNRRFYLPYFFIWLVIMTVHGYLFTAVTGRELITTIIFVLVTDAIFIVLSLLAWYPVRAIYANYPGTVSLLTSWFVLIVLLLLIWLFTAYIFMLTLIPVSGIKELFTQTLLWHGITGFFLAVITVMVYYLILSEEELKEKTLREAELKSLVTETELQYLKNQLNPHFLFNVLNNISHLILQQPDNAREMLVKLSGYLRNVLDYEKREFSTIREEMDQIHLYLDLEKIRFEDKWDYRESIQEGCEKYFVPVMILQPLFENAVRYSYYEGGAKGFIRFTCEKKDDTVMITLVNTYDPDISWQKGQGIGLRNIRKRLILIYDRDDLLQVSRKEDTFEVNLVLPLMTSNMQKT